MAVRIEKGGWILIFLIGVALVAYSLNSYGVFNIGSWLSKKDAAKTAVDPSQPLPTSGDKKPNSYASVSTSGWVASADWSPTAVSTPHAGSIYDKKGLKVSFKIIDDWTEGTAALASNNVDVMLTTADVWAKDYAQLQEKGFNARAVFMVDWSRGADGVIGKQGINSIEDLAGQDSRVRAVHALAFPALERTEEFRAQHGAAERDLRQGGTHQGRHRTGDTVRPTESGCRRRVGSRHERRRGQAQRLKENL